MSDNVLVKITLIPYGNYSGAKLIDYKILPYELAILLNKFLLKYKNETIEYYCQFDCESLIENIKVEIVNDNAIKTAYELLLSEEIIESSYHIYDRVVEKIKLLSQIENLDNDNNEEVKKLIEKLTS